jgi:hypothetical protein
METITPMLWKLLKRSIVMPAGEEENDEQVGVAVGMGARVTVGNGAINGVRLATVVAGSIVVEVPTARQEEMEAKINRTSVYLMSCFMGSSSRGFS